MGDPNESYRMRKKSGEFNSDDPITRFFYVLLRNGCSPVILEEALSQMHPTEYTNGWLGKYADDIAKRLIRRAGGWEGAMFIRKDELMGEDK